MIQIPATRRETERARNVRREGQGARSRSVRSSVLRQIFRTNNQKRFPTLLFFTQRDMVPAYFSLRSGAIPQLDQPATSFFYMSRSRKLPSKLADDRGADMVARRTNLPVGAAMISSSLAPRLGKDTAKLAFRKPIDIGRISALNVVPSK